MNKDHKMVKKMLVLIAFSCLNASQPLHTFNDLKDISNRITATDAEQRELYYPIAYEVFIPGRISSIALILSHLQSLPQDSQTMSLEKELRATLTRFQTTQKIEKTAEERIAAADAFLATRKKK